MLHSAASSAFAASRAFFLLMPTSALQAVSFRSAPSARYPSTIVAAGARLVRARGRSTHSNAAMPTLRAA